MSGYKVLLICGGVSFLIGALAPAVFVPAGTPRAINWLCLGAAFVTFAVALGAH
jgi:hypothetical protein